MWEGRGKRVGRKWRRRGRRSGGTGHEQDTGGTGEVEPVRRPRQPGQGRGGRWRDSDGRREQLTGYEVVHIRQGVRAGAGERRRRRTLGEGGTEGFRGRLWLWTSVMAVRGCGRMGERGGRALLAREDQNSKKKRGGDRGFVRACG